MFKKKVKTTQFGSAKKPSKKGGAIKGTDAEIVDVKKKKGKFKFGANYGKSVKVVGKKTKKK